MEGQQTQQPQYAQDPNQQQFQQQPGQQQQFQQQQPMQGQQVYAQQQQPNQVVIMQNTSQAMRPAVCSEKLGQAGVILCLLFSVFFLVGNILWIVGYSQALGCVSNGLNYSSSGNSSGFNVNYASESVQCTADAANLIWAGAVMCGVATIMSIVACCLCCNGPQSFPANTPVGKAFGGTRAPTSAV
jgi:hypothetical protein